MQIRFREAVRDATASVRLLAEEAGYTRVTFDKYMNERPPSRAATLALAQTLEARALKLLEHASKLREVSDENDR